MKVITDHPVAWDSPDHINPWGTKRDNSRQYRFQEKLINLMSQNKFLSVLDLGCSGGGYIADMHDLGLIALGLEGSDFSKKSNRAEWGRLKDIALFTADVTKQFRIENNNQLQHFDVISSFEVLEHIKESELKGLFDNINKHSKDHTVLIFSISTIDDITDGINLHQTVKPKEWWIAKFKEYGWTENIPLMTYFNGQYLRGNRFDAQHSFEVVLTQKSNFIYSIPKSSIKSKLLDCYNGSTLHKYFKSLYRGSHWSR